MLVRIFIITGKKVCLHLRPQNLEGSLVGPIFTSLRLNDVHGEDEQWQTVVEGSSALDRPQTGFRTMQVNRHKAEACAQAGPPKILASLEADIGAVQSTKTPSYCPSIPYASLHHESKGAFTLMHVIIWTPITWRREAALSPSTFLPLTLRQVRQSLPLHSDPPGLRPVVFYQFVKPRMFQCFASSDPLLGIVDEDLTKKI